MAHGNDGRRRAAHCCAAWLLAAFCLDAGAAVSAMGGWRDKPSATLLSDGQVLVVGGGSLGPQVEVFEPLTNAWRREVGPVYRRSGHQASLLPDGRVLVTGGAFEAPGTSNEIYDPRTRRWTFAAPSARRFDHRAVTLASGDVLVTGGTGGDGYRTAACELYETASDRFLPLPPLASPRAGHVALRLADGRVLVTGGITDRPQNPVDALASAEIFDPAAGGWTAAGAMRTPRAQHAATLLADGRVLVTGGQHGSQTLASAEIFDPATGTWTETGAMRSAKAQHEARLLPDGRVAVVGPGVPEVFDPATGTFTPWGSYATARSAYVAALLADGRLLLLGGGDTAETLAFTAKSWAAVTFPGPSLYRHSMTLLPDGRALVAGGWPGGGSASGSAYLFDPSTNAFLPAAAMPGGHAQHAAVLLPDGRVLVAGGSDSRDAVAYDSATDTWAPAGTMAQLRYETAAVLLGTGKVLVAGGSDTAGAELYDPAQDTWSPTATPGIVSYAGTSLTLLRDGRVLAAGGTTAYKAHVTATIYDPATDTWTPAAPLAIARFGHRAALLPDGRVLVWGGFGYDGGWTPSTEIYDPDRDAWIAGGNSAREGGYPAFVGLPNGDLFTVGGPWIERYDIEAGWSLLPGVPDPYLGSPTAALLNDGSVLVVGQPWYPPSGAGPAIAARLRIGEASAARAPLLASVTLSPPPRTAAVDGIGFTGRAASGAATWGAASPPVLTLQRLDGGAIAVPGVGSVPWTPLSFSSALADLPPGWYRATMAVDGVQSEAKLVRATGEPPPAGSVEFERASATVSENGSLVVAVVTRAGECTRAATVGLVAVDITARAGIDYRAPALVRWSAGDCLPKSVSIPILDNARVDGPRQFAVDLARPGNVAVGAAGRFTVTILDDESLAAAMPASIVVAANPYGALAVDGAAFDGTTITRLTRSVTITLGPVAGGGGEALHLDVIGAALGRGNKLILRAGAAGQSVLLNGTSAAGTRIDGVIATEGAAGVAPPRLQLHDADGISVLSLGRVLAPGGLVLDALGDDFRTGQPIANAGIVDGGPDLAVFGSAINGGGRFHGDAVLLSTFGHANNPVNGLHYLANGLNLAPSTGDVVRLAINDYGKAPQTFNLMIHGNAELEIPSRWTGHREGLPPNNDTFFGTGVFDASYGGGQLLVQAGGALGLQGGIDNLIAYPGGVVLRAGRTIDFRNVLVDNAWTATGRPFQGMFFEAPRIVSTSNDYAGVRFLVNPGNWVNFGSRPAFGVGVHQPNAAGIPVDVSDVAPHLNPYASMIETAAQGGCWTCNVATSPSRMD